MPSTIFQRSSYEFLKRKDFNWFKLLSQTRLRRDSVRVNSLGTATSAYKGRAYMILF